MKIREFKDKPFLLVPVINENASDALLNPQDTLVYGYLLFRAKKGRGSSKTEIRRSLRLDARAVETSLGKLGAVGLVSSEGRSIRAEEPNAQIREWFRFQNRCCEQWQDQFVYDRVYLPRSSTTLSIRTNALFWHLVRLGMPVQGMPGHLQVGGIPNTAPRFLTQEYLARGVGIYRRTVSRGLKRLLGLGLITVVSRGRHAFFVGVRPLKQNAHLWRDEWQETEVDKPVTAKELFGVPSKAPVKTTPPVERPIIRRLLQYGINGDVVVRLAEFIEENDIDPDVWKDLLKTAYADHDGNRVVDDGLPRHCGYLFLYELEKHLKIREARAFERMPPPTWEEKMAKEEIEAMNAPQGTLRLLYAAARAESLDLVDGRTIPCPLNWEEIERVAKESRRDFKTFQRSIEAELFDGVEAHQCEWLDRWRSLA